MHVDITQCRSRDDGVCHLSNWSRSQIDLWFCASWNNCSPFQDDGPGSTVGTIKISSLTIFALKPELNCWTCGRTYKRNALLLHLSWSMIVDGRTYCKNRSISKLVRIECVHTLNVSKPSLALLIKVTTVLR